MSRKTFADKIEAAVKTSDEPHVALPAALSRRPPEKTSASKRKYPRYPSESKRSKTTYDLDAGTIEAVRQIAVQERLPRNPSRVAQALLNYAVEQYRTGHIALEVEQDGPRWWLVAEAQK